MNLIFSPKVIHPLQQRGFRRIGASAVIASEKVQFSRIGSRPRGFKQAMDEFRTLPLTPQRVTKNANLSFKNRFTYISVTDQASDIKFGMQLQFAKAHHEIALKEQVGVALG